MATRPEGTIVRRTDFAKKSHREVLEIPVIRRGDKSYPPPLQKIVDTGRMFPWIVDVLYYLQTDNGIKGPVLRSQIVVCRPDVHVQFRMGITSLSDPIFRWIYSGYVVSSTSKFGGKRSVSTSEIKNAGVVSRMLTQKIHNRRPQIGRCVGAIGTPICVCALAFFHYTVIASRLNNHPYARIIFFPTARHVYVDSTRVRPRRPIVVRVSSS